MKINKRGVSGIIVGLLVILGFLLIGAGIAKFIVSKHGSVLNRLKFSSATDEKRFTVEDMEDGVRVVKYIGDEEIVIIPEEINGKKVVGVGEFSFVNNKTIKGVKLSDNVKIIESEAFENCINLEVFIAGKGLTTISNYAFNYCGKLHTIKLNEGILTLEMSCFSNNNFSEIYIPSSVTTMNMPINISAADKITIISQKESTAEKWATAWGFGFKEIK